jgi:hypothetical protein
MMRWREEGDGRNRPTVPTLNIFSGVSSRTTSVQSYADRNKPVGLCDVQTSIFDFSIFQRVHRQGWPLGLSFCANSNFDFSIFQRVHRQGLRNRSIRVSQQRSNIAHISNMSNIWANRVSQQRSKKTLFSKSLPKI